VTSSDPAIAAISGLWTLVELGGVATPDDGAHIELSADESRVSGSGGCNRLVGTFELSDTTLRFGPLATTRMACAPDVMEREDAFLRVLAETSRYELAGTTLALLDENGVLARLTSAEHASHAS
jgi:heat shock protein HslJ